MTSKERLEQLRKRALYLAECGFSYRVINEYTGLRYSQIGYYLHKRQSGVTLYRNGSGDKARKLILAMPTITYKQRRVS